MAIEKMKKLRMVGMRDQKDEILTILTELGVVEIDSYDLDHEGLKTFDNSEETVALQNDILEVKQAIDTVTRIAENKKGGLFPSKRQVSKIEYNNAKALREKIVGVAREINEVNRQFGETVLKKNNLRSRIMALKPWGSTELSRFDTKNASIKLGTVAANVSVKGLQNDISQYLAEVQVINRDNDLSYLRVIYHKSQESDVATVLMEHNFNYVEFTDMQGTALDNIAKLKVSIQELDKKYAEDKKAAKQLCSNLSSLELMFDYLNDELNKLSKLNDIRRTEYAVMINGWVPSKIADKVKNRLAEKFEYLCIELAEPEEDEETPILLKNNNFTSSFEIITEMYSMPSSRELDPNPVMAPFYFLFFGLMLSDAGYGLLLMMISFIILKKYKLEGSTKKIMRLLFWGGLSTLFWGALFGSWFGDITKVASFDSWEGIKPIWFNPMNDPLQLLMWSFVLGGIHLFAGMAMHMANLIKQGKVWDAIFDMVPWYLFLIGLVLWFGLMVTTGATWGMYVAIAGAVSLILTQGRHEKGIFKKLGTGIFSLYNVTAYLSDVLSYSRLLALGLATGVVASVMNTVGALMGPTLPGYIVLAIVFIVGHAFNIAINTLGAYVHTSRLQYVEFFGKFYTGGGREFNPLKRASKYVKVSDEL